jgi:hypothetical protein
VFLRSASRLFLLISFPPASLASSLFIPIFELTFLFLVVFLFLTGPLNTNVFHYPFQSEKQSRNRRSISYKTKGEARRDNPYRHQEYDNPADGKQQEPNDNLP